MFFCLHSLLIIFFYQLILFSKFIITLKLHRYNIIKLFHLNYNFFSISSKMIKAQQNKIHIHNNNNWWASDLNQNQYPSQISFNFFQLSTQDQKTRNLKIAIQILKIKKQNYQPKLIKKDFSISHKWFSKSNNSMNTNQYVGLDCQFVQSGKKHVLARISIVNQAGEVLLDSFVKPDQIVTNYISFVSGVTQKDVRNAPNWLLLRQQVEDILKDKILIGHSILNDLKVMNMIQWQGFKKVIDISKYSGYKQQQTRQVKGLKRLAREYLNQNIQNGAHSSVQDAQMTMRLFLKNKTSILRQLSK